MCRRFCPESERETFYRTRAEHHQTPTAPQQGGPYDIYIYFLKKLSLMFMYLIKRTHTGEVSSGKSLCGR